MANYIDCVKTGFSFESILQSMFAYQNDSQPRIAGFRIEIIEDTFEYLPECDRYESWQDLFREALDVGDDGLPMLRVVFSGIEESAPICEDWQTTENLMRQSFVRLDTSGEVALLLLVDEIGT